MDAEAFKGVGTVEGSAGLMTSEGCGQCYNLIVGIKSLRLMLIQQCHGGPHVYLVHAEQAVVTPPVKLSMQGSS